jgi:hypothetical protein
MMLDIEELGAIDVRVRNCPLSTVLETLLGSIEIGLLIEILDVENEMEDGQR